jgi:hypothetical protein
MKGDTSLVVLFVATCVLAALWFAVILWGGGF